MREAHAQPGNVAVFNNPQFIDNDNEEGPGTFEAEGPNTIASLQSFGENVTAFTAGACACGAVCSPNASEQTRAEVDATVLIAASARIIGGSDRSG